MNEPEELPTVRDCGPSYLQAGCIILGIIGLVIGIIAAYWAYKLAEAFSMGL